MVCTTVYGVLCAAWLARVRLFSVCGYGTRCTGAGVACVRAHYTRLWLYRFCTLVVGSVGMDSLLSTSGTDVRGVVCGLGIRTHSMISPLIGRCSPERGGQLRIFSKSIGFGVVHLRCRSAWEERAGSLHTYLLQP